MDVPVSILLHGCGMDIAATKHGVLPFQRAIGLVHVSAARALWITARTTHFDWDRSIENEP